MATGVFSTTTNLQCMVNLFFHQLLEKNEEGKRFMEVRVHGCSNYGIDKKLFKYDSLRRI